METNLKKRISDAAGSSDTLSPEKVIELFGDGARFTDNQIRSVVAEAKK